MVDIGGKDAEIAHLLGSLGTLCDSGFALAIHIRYTRPSLLYQTYNQAWGDCYSERGYMLVDPIVRWGLTNTGAVEWRSLSDQDTAGVIAAAESFGLHNGWSYAVGPATSRTIGGLTNSTGFTAAQRSQIMVIIDRVHSVTDGFDKFPHDLQDKLRPLP